MPLTPNHTQCVNAAVPTRRRDHVARDLPAILLDHSVICAGSYIEPNNATRFRAPNTARYEVLSCASRCKVVRGQRARSMMASAAPATSKSVRGQGSQVPECRRSIRLHRLD